jgi:D-sedoheptulose 7-phosphate isomerase
VRHAVEVARRSGVIVIGLTGETGGALAPLADVAIRVPATETFKIQEFHLPIYHCICLAVEAEMFPTR